MFGLGILTDLQDGCPEPHMEKLAVKNSC